MPRTPESGSGSEDDEGSDTDAGDGTATVDDAEATDVAGETSELLDQCEVVTSLPAGYGSITGGVPATGAGDSFAFVAVSPDGWAVVIDQESPGSLYDLGVVQTPMWSPRGRVLVYLDVSGERPLLRVWDRDAKDAAPFPIGTSAFTEGAVDLPVGWVNSRFAYLTTYPEQPGYAELHLSEWDGSNDQIVWSGEGIDLAGLQGYATFDGVFIPTRESWIFIDESGQQAQFSAPPGFVEGISVSLSAGLVAYHAGGGLYVAPVEAPDQAIAAISFSGEAGSGYALDPDGRGIAVVDGGALTVFSLYGEVLGSATSVEFIAGPAWQADGIYFLRLGEATDVCRIRPDQILGGS